MASIKLFLMPTQKNDILFLLCAFAKMFDFTICLRATDTIHTSHWNYRCPFSRVPVHTSLTIYQAASARHPMTAVMFRHKII